MFVYTVTIMDEDAAVTASCALVTCSFDEAHEYAYAYIKDTLIAGATILVVTDDGADWLLEYPEGRLCSVKVEEHNL